MMALRSSLDCSCTVAKMNHPAQTRMVQRTNPRSRGENVSRTAMP
ncbi:hypothetical protein SAMN05421854_10383 [Amycolatopsis rubida]|uniref:Uncharacterized protein n=1 Tax=Amycolatopsis rubida TaxID=112413 RepID=A0A1I5K8G9_9PSEU|nr:hypothetical protein SAMN05421854_10383 [Amycolatopsis rubida]